MGGQSFDAQGERLLRLDCERGDGIPFREGRLSMVEIAQGAARKCVCIVGLQLQRLSEIGDGQVELLIVAEGVSTPHIIGAASTTASSSWV